MDDKRERGPRVVVVNGESFPGAEPRHDPLHDRPREQPTEFDEAPVERAAGEPVRRQGEHSEAVQRVHVEPEDRLAFRVGVNILTLVLIGLAAYVVWRNFFQ